jgi:hypothetical protein
MHKLPVVPICRIDLFRFSEYVLTPAPNRRHYPRRPALAQEGRFAIVTNVERGMRWTRQVSAQTLRGRLILSRTQKSCGPDTPTLVSSS